MCLALHTVHYTANAWHYILYYAYLAHIFMLPGSNPGKEACVPMQLLVPAAKQAPGELLLACYCSVVVVSTQ